MQFYLIHSAGVQCDLEIVLLGNHVQVNNEDKGSSTVTEEVVSEVNVSSLLTQPF